MNPTAITPVATFPAAATHAAAIPADGAVLLAPADHAPPAAAGLRAAVTVLTKPGITKLVTITSAVGFAMAAFGRGTPWFTLEMLLAAVGATLGTALSAAGANALNQWMETARDAVMPRTARRPIPAGALTPFQAFAIGTSLCIAGLAVLWAMTGMAPALVSLATILSYLLIYTPLKPVTPLATLVGAVPGALPPLIGWSAAMLVGTGLTGMDSIRASLTGAAGAGGWALFILMFVWQVPHFLAIAWLYRDDYAKGGYKVLPVIDPTGASTSAVIMLWTATLLMATLGPALAMPDQLGAIYLAVVVLTGVPFFLAAVRLARRRTRPDAKHVFLASIAHLPLLLLAMVVDGLFHAL